MLFRRIFNRLRLSRGKWGVYLLEVLLIMLSVLLAIQADRYNQERKNETKLKAYLQALYQDLKDEQFSNENNLDDCLKDMEDLISCIRLARMDHNDSLNASITHLQSVYRRGVFRAFPPTTFDIMISSGDITLVKDLAFRNRLAATFAFRDSYLKKDLQNHDAQTRHIAKSMSPYLDLACLSKTEAPYQCIIDREGYINDQHNDLFLFLQLAEERAFHLKVGIRSFDYTIKEMEELYGELLVEE